MSSFDYTSRPEDFRIPLESTFKNSLIPTTHDQLVYVKAYKPGSVSTVVRYNQPPIIPQDTKLGKENKASILGNLYRSSSAKCSSSTDTWIKDQVRTIFVPCNNNLIEKEKVLKEDGRNKKNTQPIKKHLKTWNGKDDITFKQFLKGRVQRPHLLHDL